MPVMALSEVVGNIGTVAPAQKVAAVPKLNVGVTFGITVTENDPLIAHWPALGMNVYVAEF